MNIGVEAGVLYGRRTGIGNYAYNIMRTLRCQDTDIHFLTPHSFGWKEVSFGSFSEPPIAADSGIFNAKMRMTIAKLPAVRTSYQLLRSAIQKKTYRSSVISLFHAFNFVPASEPTAPILPVVYDLSFIRYPEMHPAARVQWLKRLPFVLDRARLVHTISEFSRREIADVFGYPLDRILVSYPAARAHFCPKGRTKGADALRRLGLEWRSYMLAVGTLEPRKNLQTLLLAYARLPASARATCPLVIAGGQGWGSQTLYPQVETLLRNGEVRFLGYVSDDDLPRLYEGARLTLYPSIYEGFGMPVVEAMACGSAVAHSKNTSMDEISEGLAFRVDALDVEGWSECMRTVLRSEDLESERLARIERSRRFDWTASAQVVKEAYEHLLN